MYGEGWKKSVDLPLMTNVFTRVIVGKFAAILVSLSLSVGCKGNKSCFKVCDLCGTNELLCTNFCICTGVHLACRSSVSFTNERTLLAIMKVCCWTWHLLSLLVKKGWWLDILPFQITYLWHPSKWIPVDRTFRMMFCTALGKRDRLRVQKVPCTTDFQHLDRNCT